MYQSDSTRSAPTTNSEPDASVHGASEPDATDSRAPHAQYLAFCLGSEEYGVDLMQVQELRSYEPVTRIANAPDFLKGFVNLRGCIVPILDMRIRLGLAATYDAFTVVVIVSLGSQMFGIVVDSVSDVISLSPHQIKPAPAMGAAANTDHLVGIGTLDARMLSLVDTSKLFADSGFDMQTQLAA